jgi:murein tripeptide amidase MpaA
MIKLSLLWLFVIISTVVVINADRKSYNGYKLFAITANCENDVEILRQIQYEMNGVDFWDEVNSSKQTLRVLVAPDQIYKFNTIINDHGIQSVIVNENLDRMIETHILRDCRQAVNIPKSTIDFNHFWNWDEIDGYLSELAEQYPSIAKVETIGQTYEGRDIKAIKISLNGNVTGDNPIILIDSAMHAREWIAPMVALKIIHELVEHKNDNENLLNGLDWIIVPVVNIDGYIYTFETDRFWRKTRSINQGSNCIGVDPNRNFNYQWSAINSTQLNDPCNLIYRGPYPNSEKEVQAVSRLMEQFESTRLYLSLHSYGQYFLYPWTYDRIRIDNYLDHETVATLASDAIYATNGTRYKTGTSFEHLSLSSGVSKDYAVGVGKIDYSFTVELPGGGANGFDIPASRIPAVMTETFNAIIEFGKYISEQFN